MSPLLQLRRGASRTCNQSLHVEDQRATISCAIGDRPKTPPPTAHSPRARHRRVHTDVRALYSPRGTVPDDDRNAGSARRGVAMPRSFTAIRVAATTPFERCSSVVRTTGHCVRLQPTRGGEAGAVRAELQALAADGVRRKIDDLAVFMLSALGRGVAWFDESGAALHLNRPADVCGAVNCVRGERDDAVVEGTLAQSVLAETVSRAHRDRPGTRRERSQAGHQRTARRDRTTRLGGGPNMRTS